MGFPGGSVVKNLPVNTGDMSSIPGSGKIPWRKKWKPTPIFLPVKSHGQRSLASYGPGGHKRQTQLSMHACTHTHTHTQGLGTQEELVLLAPSLFWVASLKLSMSSQIFVFPSISSLSFYTPRTTVTQHDFSVPPPD